MKEKLNAEMLHEFAEGLNVCCLTYWDGKGKERLYVNDARRDWVFQSGKVYIGKKNDDYYFCNLLDEEEQAELTSDQKEDLEYIQGFVERLSPKLSNSQRQADMFKFFDLDESKDSQGLL